MMDAWNPDQYERFKAERDQPFHDLVALCDPAPGGRMIDLGCGTGALTRVAHDALGVAETTGIDRSESMLARAVEHAGGGLTFTSGDVATLEPDGTYDIVLANAVLHWIPHHDRVIARWAAALRAGGQIAVQVPANQDHPSQTVAWEVAREPEFAAALGGFDVTQAAGIRIPEEYSVLLYDLGFAEQHVRTQVYLHAIDSAAGMVEWTKGTFLLQFEQRMPPDLFERFVARYTELLLAAVDDRSPFPYTFKRVLMWARRP